MRLTITNKQYTLEKKVDTLLEALIDIKKYQDNSLTFKSGCRSGVCGSCAVVVNGTERLACITKVSNDDIVEPLRNLPVITSLVTTNNHIGNLLNKAQNNIGNINNDNITKADEEKIDKVSSCILCSSCYSSCPVYSVNSDFIGPFALTRAYRYIEDKKLEQPKTIIDNIQENGVFSCTLCGNCNMVCPEQIDIKGAIMQLQNKSIQYGYSNPNLITDFGGGLDFGFNPNQF